MSKKYPLVKAPGSLDFQLHTLGWRNFQDLCAAVLDKVLGQSFTVFADSNDGGRDGAFYGSWNEEQLGGPTSGIKSGSTVVQCKFTVKADSTLSLSNISDELAKIKNLTDQGICDNYILMTNARVTGTSEASIREAIIEAGAKNAYILDGNWICRQILKSQSLRLFVPRVYGLGDLSQILDERAYAQAAALLDQLEGLSTFVVTDSYKKAAKSLQDDAFVLLLGEPASGKSVIAASLAMAALDSWKTPVIKVSNAQNFIEHWNTEQEGQFFWIDDAFGAVRHEQVLTDEWARALPTLMTAIKKGSKVVMTSRDYIYREAKPLLKDYAYPLLKEAQVVINVSQLSLDEKQHMLYNHIKLGNQPQPFKTSIKHHLNAVSSVSMFLPEVARRLGTKTFTTNINASMRQDVVSFMQNPKQYLEDIFEGLDQNHKAALALVYKSTNLSSPVKLDSSQREVIERLGGDPSKLNESLQSLNGTFLRYSTKIDKTLGSTYWTFHHPTLREGFASFIMTSTDLIDIFIEGLEIPEALDQLDCGTGNARGQLIKVPKSSYEHVVKVLSGYEAFRQTSNPAVRSHNEVRMNTFLARSSKSFIKLFLKSNPTFIENNLLNFGYFIIYQSSLTTLGHFAKLGLLPEPFRLKVVEYFRRVAIETPDSAWLRDTYSSLITDAEREEILELVQYVMIPNLPSLIEEWQNDEDGEDASYYASLEETIEDYQSALFMADKIDDVEDELKEALDQVIELGEQHTQRRVEANMEDSLYDDERPGRMPAAEARSMFDDIDQ